MVCPNLFADEDHQRLANMIAPLLPTEQELAGCETIAQAIARGEMCSDWIRTLETAMEAPFDRYVVDEQAEATVPQMFSEMYLGLELWFRYLRAVAVADAALTDPALLAA